MELPGSVSVVEACSAAVLGAVLDLLCAVPEAGPAPAASPTAPLTQPQKPPVPDFLQYSQVTSPSAELSL